MKKLELPSNALRDRGDLEQKSSADECRGNGDRTKKTIEKENFEEIQP